ncbi:monocarboxylate transporter 12-like [Patiria miniata]|uniref:Major facilitator superfamily (MFS) profile domain-containing protein n=1 Tax=Patiria miniata TaxID=46514 RepID=A0A914AJU0_PATMI|nr:monocarboxylate transporter 12-like [Patiria miniata]
MERSKLGVFATIAVFIQYFINAMVVKSLGILLVSMMNEFEAETWVVGTVFSLVECGKDIFGPLAAPIGRKFGARAVVMVAGGMIGLGFILTSRASNVLQMALPLILLIALGQCLANVLTRSSLGEHFDVKDFALASGVARIGSSLSLVCLPPLVQLFLNTYGWRGAMLLVGSIGTHLTVSGALLKPVPKWSEARVGYQSLPDSSRHQPRPVHKPDKHTDCTLTSFRSFLEKSWGALDISLMKSLTFWEITLIVVTTRISQSVWYIYFVPRVVAIGFSNEEAAGMVSVAAVFQLVTFTLGGIALYKEKMTSSSAMMVSVGLVAVSFLIDPWVTSWWSVSANAALFVSSMGMVFTMVDFMVKELLGVDKMADAFGWMGFLSGLIRPLAGFIPGWIYDHTGSYDTAFVILGVIQITALIPLLIKRLKNMWPLNAN